MQWGAGRNCNTHGKKGRRQRKSCMTWYIKKVDLSSLMQNQANTLKHGLEEYLRKSQSRSCSAKLCCRQQAQWQQQRARLGTMYSRCIHVGTLEQNHKTPLFPNNVGVLRWLFLLFFPFPWNEEVLSRLFDKYSSQAKNWQLYPLTSTVHIFPVLTHFPVN